MPILPTSIEGFSPHVDSNPGRAIEGGQWKPQSAPRTHARHGMSFLSWMAPFLPAWLTKRTNSDTNPNTNSNEKQRQRTRPTAYLDGLRGFAALVVYWGHHELWAHEGAGVGKAFELAYGYDNKYYFACLPGVRTIFAGGHFAVSVFFVLSGYVLSMKPLGCIQDGDYAELGKNLSSAVFRRWFRLYIPVICTTFGYLTFLHLFKIRTIPELQGSYRSELWSWYAEFKNFSFVLRTGGEPWFTYNFHVWSIPVEYRGSLVVYTAALAFARFRRNARLIGEVALVGYLLYIADGAHFAMFVAGMLLRDLDLLAMRNDLPGFFRRLEPFKSVMMTGLFYASLYLGGVPSHTDDLQQLRDSTGWYLLSFLKPQAVFDYKWFYLFWAAVFLVSCASHLQWLKAFFAAPVNQYLGRISFAFYLVHGPVLWTLGDRLYAAVGLVRDTHAHECPWWINRLPLPTLGPFGLELNFLIPQLILLPLTLWLAEVTTRLVDEPAVRFSQRMYQEALADKT
ncbi:hypothetical protein KXV52_009605 [Aspergillus fumigatus]|nr:hypothetical protein CNMCM8686_003187 [Aspergillus fumigatus]KAH1267996.1 hypothetical protein KXX45_005599 [Aspergillus fumigatus]KAH1271192.1 hypothetical protein KXX48_006895 [Aspergillus fumigatus]KAH1408279.1 hypothetical protein KXX51_006245 [Aspergillus fumigatus]KAH1573475.1 hypothetical protein KXX28_004923 [Aspergillus fumigatus]